VAQKRSKPFALVATGPNPIYCWDISYLPTEVRGIYFVSALAWIATSKFDDGLPLYRQAALLARLAGGDLSRNTMAASMVRVGIGVQPIINVMRDHLLESPITFGDETTLQVLKEAGRSPQSKSCMWAQMSDTSGTSGTGPPIRLFSSQRETRTVRYLKALRHCA
jgi:transposase